MNTNGVYLQPGTASKGAWLYSSDGSIMGIADGGYVGIGTANPGAKLQVEGGIVATSSNTYTPGTGQLMNSGLRMEHDSAVNSLGAVGLNLAINRAVPAAVIRNNSGPALIVENGNVGIPLTLLDLQNF